MLTTTEPQYWEQRYQENSAKWDIGMAAPPLASLLDLLGNKLKKPCNPN